MCCISRVIVARSLSRPPGCCRSDQFFPPPLPSAAFLPCCHLIPPPTGLCLATGEQRGCRNRLHIGCTEVFSAKGDSGLAQACFPATPVGRAPCSIRCPSEWLPSVRRGQSAKVAWRPCGMVRCLKSARLQCVLKNYARALSEGASWLAHDPLLRRFARSGAAKRVAARVVYPTCF